ncbi:MAG: hypothetical protein M0R66_07725 [Candidatus Omnitrophica bacterium]|nr:hypothetical protein [Candidatus Omnitrophota bacterium]
MYLITDYHVGLDVNNCVAFYTNFDDNLLARLRRDYEGMCFEGHLILRVLRVMRVGECAFVQSTHPNIGSLSVAFRALIVNYSPRDIIAGCVVRPIREHGRVVMQSQHANTMIIQSREDQDVAVLGAGAVVVVRAIGTFAGPGYDRISVNATLFEPATVTYYYPIARNLASAPRTNALAREKYAPIASFSGGDDDAPPEPVNVIRAAMLASDYLARALAAAKEKHDGLPTVIRALFYPFRAPERKPTPAPDAPIALLNILDGRVPANATCVIMPREYNPLDPLVATTTAPISALPSDWVQGELAQPEDVVLARRLEQFIDFAIAGATMAREFADHAKLEATRALIVLQTGKKT